MRFKTDENLSELIARRLRDAGHDAMTVEEQEMCSFPDPSVIAICKTEDRALITMDHDFSDIRRFPPEDYPGIIILRPQLQSARIFARMAERILAELETHTLPGKLWIVDDAKIRIKE